MKRVGNNYGYWADNQLGSEIFSHLSKPNTNETRASILDSVRSSLQWLLDDSIASRIEVDLISNIGGRVNFEILIYDFDNNDAFTFGFLWDSHRQSIELGS